MLCFAAVVGVAACALLVAVLVVRGVVEASLWAGVLAALAGGGGHRSGAMAFDVAAVESAVRAEGT